MKTLTEKRFFEWHEDDKSVTLREKSGSYGGGVRSTCYRIYQPNGVIGTLCGTDNKWIQQQHVVRGKLIVIVKDAIEDTENSG